MPPLNTPELVIAVQGDCIAVLGLQTRCSERNARVGGRTTFNPVSDSPIPPLR